MGLGWLGKTKLFPYSNVLLYFKYEEINDSSTEFIFRALRKFGDGKYGIRKTNKPKLF